MKKLHIITCQPDDLPFFSETLIQLNQAREFGYSDLFRVLVFLPHDKLHLGIRKEWSLLQEWFPEAKFFYYFDTGNLLETMRRVDYIPLLRPYMLAKHFEAFPELSEDVTFYMDADVLLPKGIEFLSPLMDDDVNYLSYTGNRHGIPPYNYICADHFYDKFNNLKPETKEQALGEDILSKLMSIFSLTSKDFITRKNRVGGCQYLLKGVDSSFFYQMLEDCIRVKYILANFNQTYMNGDSPIQRENNGIQSFCTDMWALLFGLWRLNKPTLCPPSMDFLWATDTTERWETTNIFHNAGGGHGIFNKRALQYMNNEVTYFQTDNSYVLPEFCSIKYIDEINKCKEKYFPLPSSL